MDDKTKWLNVFKDTCAAATRARLAGNMKDAQSYDSAIESMYSASKMAFKNGFTEDCLSAIETDIRNGGSAKWHLYSVRPYFGHDCNSWDGFNNGYYLEEIKVSAPDEATAIGLAMEVYLSRPHVDRSLLEINPSHMSDNCVYYEYAHTDKDGNDINKDDYDHDEGHGYLYQYVDFNELITTINGPE